MEQIQSRKNGFYTHIVYRDRSAFETFRLSPTTDGSSSFRLSSVGQATFPGESIVSVAYPERDEAVQSPCTVLGDDSLLLKYLNPHLAAVFTMSVPGADDDGELAKAIKPAKAAAKKPLGVIQAATTTGESATAEKNPNFFVNLVDTVSGRILYRTSHSNVIKADHVPAVISENWVIYAYFNEKTRRTELGVLTLYEGMIDKAGLTVFSSPEQVTSFSSMEARESKPVVLSKTYAVVMPVNAMGVTSSKNGISPKNLVIASGDDRITAINRNLLEPRRPTGEVKAHEKEEGLFQ
jgi:hypothetical protein